LVLGLPQPTIRAMMFRAMAVQGACLAGLNSDQRPVPAAEADRLLTAKEAAIILSISPLTLLRNRQHAPYRDFVVSTGARSPRFSFQRMQQYINAPDRTQRR
jgi:hypothetical protein